MPVSGAGRIQKQFVDLDKHIDSGVRTSFFFLPFCPRHFYADCIILPALLLLHHQAADSSVKRIQGRLKRDFARVQKEAGTILKQARQKVRPLYMPG